MEYLHKNHLLNTLVHIAHLDNPSGIRGQVVKTFASLIDLLDDKFLVHSGVHGPVVRLLRTCVGNEDTSVGSADQSYHEDLVDLMYIICSKIRGYPDLLMIFFHDKNWLRSPQKNSPRIEASRPGPGHRPSASVTSVASISSTDGRELVPPSHAELPPVVNQQEQQPGSDDPEYEFLLFTFLVGFVHREGRTGDFARTGLLFIMDLATNQNLADFILESDFTNIMAAGLGALYSQLPRKLLVKASTAESDEANGALLGIIDDDADYVEDLEAIRSGGLELSSSPEFRAQLDSFFKLFEFWQDVLQRCPNQEICDTLLLDIKSLFLENILYPSILECSDTDGSAVAVISYLDTILQTIEHEGLVNVVVGYLMDIEPEQPEEPVINEIPPTPMTPSSRAHKRRSMALRQVSSSMDSKPTNYFTALGRFTLQDLIFSRLKSDSEATMIATLKLLHTLISKHCRFFLRLVKIEIDHNATCFANPASSLLNAMPFMEEKEGHGHGHDMLSPSKHFTTIGHHQQELDFFFTLVTTIDPTAFGGVRARDFSTGFEHYLRDAENLLESDTCYQTGLTLEYLAEEERLSALTGGNVEQPSEQPGEIKVDPLNGHATKAKATPGSQAARMTDLAKKTVPRHRIMASDPLMKILQDLLSNFFAHSTELNLSLTGVISALAVCPYRSLEDWLVRSNDGESVGPTPIKEAGLFNLSTLTEESDEEDMEAKEASFLAAVGPSTPPYPKAKASSSSTIFEIIRNLASTIARYRSDIEDFDAHLEERRQGLLFVENLSDALEAMNNEVINPRKPDDSIAKPPTVPQNTPAVSALRSPPPTDTPTRVIPAWIKTPTNAGTPASPFSVHLTRTKAIKVRPLTFSPSKEDDSPSRTLSDSASAEDDDVFAPKSSKRLSVTTDSASLSSRGTGRTMTGTQAADAATAAALNQDEVSLSTVLNNVVILEEAVKELVALVQVRRSLGVDEVRFMV